MIEIEYVYILLALIFFKEKYNSKFIFLVGLLMTAQILTNITSIVDLGFAVVFGYVAYSSRMEENKHV